MWFGRGNAAGVIQRAVMASDPLAVEGDGIFAQLSTGIGDRPPP